MELYLHAETTGRLPRPAHIIEVAAIVMDANRNEIAVFEILAHPGAAALREADPEVMRQHGITEAELAGAMPGDQAARQLDVFLDRFPDAPMRAFNNETSRSLFSIAPWKAGSRIWAQGIRAEAGVVMGTGRMPRFAEAMRHFGLEMPSRRRALSHVRAVARLHSEILQFELGDDVLQDEAFHMFEHGL